MGPGVKGRPQACFTCRRRKKGCDLQRPSCGQCRKACIPCDGYTSDITRSGVSPSLSLSQSSSSESPSPSVSSAWQTPVPGPPQYYDLTNTVPRYKPIEDSESLSVDELALKQTLEDAYGFKVESIHHADSTFPESHNHSSPLQLRPADYSPSSRPHDNSKSLSSHRTIDVGPFTGHNATSSPKDGDSHGIHDRNKKSLRLQKHRRMQQSRQQRSHPRQDNGSPYFSVNLAKAGEDERMVGAFWEAYLPNSQPFPQTDLFELILGDTLIRDLSRGGTALYKSLLALGLSTMGRRKNDRMLIEEGGRIYTEAIHQLAQSFRSKQQWVDEQLPVPRLLGMWEALYGRDQQTASMQGKSCMLHGSGEAAIVASNHPSAFMEGRNHRLFVAGRHHMCLFAFVGRKRTFLSDPAWKTIPWTGKEKTPRDLLLDIIVDLPSVIEGFELMRNETDPAQCETYRLYLRRAAYNISDRLLEWHEQHAMPTLPETIDGDLPERLTHTYITANHIMTLYWAVCMRLMSLHYVLNRPGEPLEDRFDMRQYCSNTIRACRLFMHPSAGLFRQHISSFPLSSALQYLNMVGEEHMKEERAKIWEVLYQPESAAVLQFILSMEPQAGPPS